MTKEEIQIQMSSLYDWLRCEADGPACGYSNHDPAPAEFKTWAEALADMAVMAGIVEPKIYPTA